MARRTAAEGWVGLPSGARVFYRRSGTGDPVVLIHGIAHSSDAWAAVAPRIAQRYEVIALDLPGSGRSDKPSTDYSVGAQGAAVRYVLDALDLDLVTVIGHSLGGGIAMMLAYQYPERVGRLGLVASAGFGRDLHPLFRVATLPVLPRHVMRAAFHPRVRSARNLTGTLLSAVAGDPFFYRPLAHRREFESLLSGLEDPGAQHAFLATLRSSSTLAGQSISALDRIRAARFPVLLVWGRQDRVFPVAHAERAAAALPGARLVIIEHCGHFPQIEAARDFTAALLQWLGETTPERTYPSTRAPAA